jgi:hypothetical protein
MMQFSPGLNEVLPDTVSVYNLIPFVLSDMLASEVAWTQTISNPKHFPDPTNLRDQKNDQPQEPLGPKELSWN